MEETKSLITSVLTNGYLMSLATVDATGPWVSDVIYVFSHFDIYWISHEKTRHSQAIIDNPQVAATITLCNKRDEDGIGIQVEGRAEKLEGEQATMMTYYQKKRGKGVASNDATVLSAGKFWYCLKPAKIELIDEPKWGFTKKVLLLK